MLNREWYLLFQKLQGKVKLADEMKYPIEITHNMPKMWQKKCLMACSLLSSYFLVKLWKSRTRPKGLPLKLIISRHIVNRSTQMEITENQLHKIKQIYLTVLSERNIQCSDRTFRSHDQNDKVYRNKLSTQPFSESFRET